MNQNTGMRSETEQGSKSKGTRRLFATVIAEERRFIVVIILAFILAAFTFHIPHVAMWVGFLFAAYSAIANDSIQTIGTFIASNRGRPWWQLWLFIGGVFVITVTVSWLTYGGPISVDISGLPSAPEDAAGEQALLRVDYGSDNFQDIRLQLTDGKLQSLESLGANLGNGIPTVHRVVIGWPQNQPAQKNGKRTPLKIVAEGKPQDSAARNWSLISETGQVYGTVTIDLEHAGDVSYSRLSSKGFETAPKSFHFLQLAAPLFLIILTRLRMPVSTTFLLLSVFAASGKSIGAVTMKSISGYFIAFICAIILWGTLGPWMKQRFTGEAHPAWRMVQWITTGLLWSVWLQQDAANIAVFLPRTLTLTQFIAFASVIFFGLGLLFRMGGEKIQEVVDEKSDVFDVRPATIIDLLYSVILYIFKFASKVPMSTTWVFVGLLAGREISMAARGANTDGRTLIAALRLAGRDLLFVTIGFIISMLLAAAINPAAANALFH